MPLSRKQKEQLIQQENESLKGSETVVIADFTGLPVNDVTTLRKALRETGASMRVIKKRLLKIMFQEQGIDLDPKTLEGQTGVVFSPQDFPETAQTVYKFAKEHKENFSVLGGVKMQEKEVVSKEELETIGNLPSREVLIGQLVGMITYPLRSFMVVLNERSKKL